MTEVNNPNQSAWMPAAGGILSIIAGALNIATFSACLYITISIFYVWHILSSFRPVEYAADFRHNRHAVYSTGYPGYYRRYKCHSTQELGRSLRRLYCSYIYITIIRYLFSNFYCSV